jgi:hypothetical protein
MVEIGIGEMIFSAAQMVMKVMSIHQLGPCEKLPWQSKGRLRSCFDSPAPAAGGVSTAGPGAGAPAPGDGGRTIAWPL